MATPTWSLRRLLLFGATALVVLPAVAAGTLYTSKVRKQTTDFISADLNDRGEWAARQIVGRLDQLWQQVIVMSKGIDLANRDRLRDEFTLITQMDNRFSWLGIAD